MSKFILNALAIMLLALFLMGFIYLVSLFLYDILGIDIGKIIRNKIEKRGKDNG